MKIFIDADACPVINETIQVAQKYNISVIAVCDTCHIIKNKNCNVIVVDKQADSADYAIINRMEKGDVCITQDYGLAAMVLSKECFAIHQNGFMYNSDNIDRMLFERHISKKSIRKGKYPHKHKKRTQLDNTLFYEFFNKFIASL